MREYLSTIKQMGRRIADNSYALYLLPLSSLAQNPTVKQIEASFIAGAGLGSGITYAEYKHQTIYKAALFALGLFIGGSLENLLTNPSAVTQITSNPLWFCDTAALVAGGLMGRTAYYALAGKQILSEEERERMQESELE
jgi:hypothetical protein